MHLESNKFAEIDDIVVIDTGILGKIAYKVTHDFLHIKLENIDNGFEHDQVFKNLEELSAFINDSPSIQLVPLH
ncbi:MULTISPECIES: hypothetical protein [Bacillus subtilis group]|uniref:hypothetical protein n=1 Tax=Bacillus subtilis group TaxID=653685 RepID=UPI001A912E64|nr:MULTISPECIES: hypothetical protein [Bacillus subtilis group]MCY9308754.1 hypothetical protein [Bacillus inaquosorum]BCT30327.1 hypothetical protein BVAD3_40010 [Bacillus velezensis]